MKNVAPFILCLALVIGCGHSNDPELSVSVTLDQSAEALTNRIEESLASARTTHEMLQSNFRQFRVKVLGDRVSQGLATIEELLAASDATPDQLEAARCAESELLFYGATNCGEDFVEQLSACAQKNMTDNRESDSCRLALARWLHYRYANQPAAFDEALATINEFASAYPDSAEAVQMIDAFSKRLIEEGEFANARRAVKDGCRLVADPNLLKNAYARIKKHRKRELQLAAQKATEQLYRAKVKSILGGRERGYFIVHSFEKKKSWEVYVDYSVCHGIDSVVEYAKVADKTNWGWELIQAYPDNDKGFHAATSKMRHLVKTQTRTVFGS